METQKLFELIQVNEKAERFNFKKFVSPCGTYGCLVGNDFIENYKNRPILSNGPRTLLPLISVEWSFEKQIAPEYGVTEKEARWLFDIVSKRQWNWRTGEWEYRYRDDVTREQAINRVRKFIYYKLHKQEMLYDEKGCIRESARRAEGNHMVTKEVELCLSK